MWGGMWAYTNISIISIIMIELAIISWIANKNNSEGVSPKLLH